MGALVDVNAYGRHENRDDGAHVRGRAGRRQAILSGGAGYSFRNAGKGLF